MHEGTKGIFVCLFAVSENVEIPVGGNNLSKNFGKSSSIILCPVQYYCISNILVVGEWKC